MFKISHLAIDSKAVKDVAVAI